MSKVNYLFIVFSSLGKHVYFGLAVFKSYTSHFCSIRNAIGTTFALDFKEVKINNDHHLNNRGSLCIHNAKYQVLK